MYLNIILPKRFSIIKAMKQNLTSSHCNLGCNIKSTLLGEQKILQDIVSAKFLPVVLAHTHKCARLLQCPHQCYHFLMVGF